MTTQSELLSAVEAFLAAQGMKETTFGVLALNDGKFVGRLRLEKNMTIVTIARVLKFMADYPATKQRALDAA